MDIFGFLGTPLGYVIYGIYQVIPSYFWALVVFTIIIRAALFPLAIKQQKSMAKNAYMQPKMKAIQEKYKNDRQKQQEEMAKLGGSPLGGCLPMAVQMFVLFGVYSVVRQPLTHLLRFGAKDITFATDFLKNLGEKISILGAKSGSPEIDIFNAFDKGIFAGLNLPEKFLWIGNLNLGATPQFGQISWLWLLPIISGATAFISSWLSMKFNSPNSLQTTPAPGSGMTKSMLYIMPLISVFFAFQVPSGLIVYWILSNIFTVVQVLILNKFWNIKKLAAAVEAEEKAKNKAQKSGKIQTTVVNKEGKKEEVTLTKKERLEKARREYLEKYGD